MNNWIFEYTLKGTDSRGNPMVAGCTYEQAIKSDTKDNALMELRAQYPSSAKVVVKSCVKGAR